ncbi:Hypothetical predicted protein [Paramuricea clavata]|uniref:Uncharacterized protein n=1 Tax=Paramuricea clavata TaxID=317549 RepID=A0A6S7FVE5_PARCT|nr:Hypothetical predicted protein [Paramuricea clavata]
MWSCFPVKKKLAAHKQQTNQLQRKRKIGNASKARASEPKQRRLDETLILENASVPERNPADHDQQEEEACNLCHQEDVDENEEDIDVDDWVQCGIETCQKWCHIYCVNSMWPDRYVVNVDA